MTLKTKKIIFATFSPWVNGKRLPTNGTVEPMRDYLVPKIRKFVLIDQPIPGSDRVMPRIEVYENHKISLKRMSLVHYWLWPFLRLVNKHGTRLTFKLRDFFSVLDWGITNKDTYDLLIGMESINALAGLLLKELGKVKKVAYYVSDYSPHRYPQKWFNDLYLWLDRFCATHADYIWDVSKAMHPARIKAGLPTEKSAPEIHLPNGLYPGQIKSLLLNKIWPYSIVYMGTLGRENGPDLIIKALPLILKKYPQANLHVVGGNQRDIHELQKVAQEISVAQKVKFYGFIESAEEMSKIVRQCYVAVAPYRAIAGSPRYFADAGKIRVYAAAGVPVVTTKVPPLGQELEKKGGGIIVEDTTQSFAQGVIKLFADKVEYLKMRKKTLEFAKHSTWDNVFDSVFQCLKN